MAFEVKTWGYAARYLFWLLAVIAILYFLAVYVIPLLRILIYKL